MEDCKIAYQGSFASLPAREDLPNTFKLKEKSVSTASLDTKAQTKRLQDAGAIVSDKDKGNLLQSGDRKLYWYYFKSIGWKYATIYLFLEFSKTVLTTFSRKSLWFKTKAGALTLLEIWLKWWTEANSGDAPVSLGKYFGVYSLILFSCTMMLGAGI